ncbi:MAG: hypothetical protein RL481_1744, partial [Pseudomonadota bacterium]
MQIAARHAELLAAGELKRDSAQTAIVSALAALQEKLEEVPPRGSLLWRFAARKPEAIRGLYIWGDVGRGKSMLMDLFYDNVDIGRKQRRHFHEFMLDMHARIRAMRESNPGDPIPKVARDIAQDTRLLCFDEMVVNNMADAAIMSRLFAQLMEEGVTIVTT